MTMTNGKNTPEDWFNFTKPRTAVILLCQKAPLVFSKRVAERQLSTHRAFTRCNTWAEMHGTQQKSTDSIISHVSVRLSVTKQ